MRTGHEVVGKLVALCESRKCKLTELPLADLQSACDKIEADVATVLGTHNVVAALKSYGSGGRTSVQAQLTEWQEHFKVR